MSLFAVGVKDGDAALLCAIAGGDVGEAHFVAAALGQLGREGERLLAFAGVEVVEVAVADVAVRVLRVFPLADELGGGVVDDDAGQLIRREHRPLLSVRGGSFAGELRGGELGGLEVGFQRGDFGLVRGEDGFLIGVRRAAAASIQWATLSV